jgi:hypothetical protein
LFPWRSDFHGPDQPRPQVVPGKFGQNSNGSDWATTYLYNPWFILEHGPGQGRLAAVIEDVRICAVLDQKFDERCMAVISGKHDLQQLAQSQISVE